MIWLWYVFLVFLLLFKVRIFRGDTWNDSNLSLDQTKCFLGFCSVIVMFHHLAQNTCGPWRDADYIRHGLDIFLNAGYPMVAVFFFCSGFGLYKSIQNKPDYFKKYLVKRIVPILIPSLITELVFVFIRVYNNIPIVFNSPVLRESHETIHPFIWYIPCILYLYFLFYLGFGIIKKESLGFSIVAVGIIIYILFCVCFRYKAFWYNSLHLFFIGLLFSKYEKKIFGYFKEKYIFKLLFVIFVSIVFWILSENSGDIFLSMVGQNDNGDYLFTKDLITSFSQSLYALSFVFLIYLITMKIRITNPILSFFGKITLEFYLVHGIFVCLFDYCLLLDNVKSLYYIESVPLYVLVVITLSIPSAYLLNVFDKLIVTKMQHK